MARTTKVKRVTKTQQGAAQRFQAYPLEREEQAVLAQYLDARGVLWFHPPNEGKRKAWIGAKMKTQGLKSGVPDVLIFERWYDKDAPTERATGFGLAIELKRQAGGNASQAQYDWLVALQRRGWKAVVCHGATEAITWLEKRL
jgi:hypothetical protein